MPIGGFVIHVDPARKSGALQELGEISELEIYAADEKGQVVAVLDTETSAEMESLVNKMEGMESVLSVGLTYFHAEDESDKIARGELSANFSFGRKGEKPADLP